jgi:uncharacterized protein YecT (DUF1311 family)
LESHIRRPFAILVATLAAAALAGSIPAWCQTQTEMTAAARRAYLRADKALNAAYQRLAASLDPAPRAKLKTAELAWLRFRDAEGEFRASEFKGGSIQPAARLGYLEELTRRRTLELNNAYKQFVGD